MKQYTLLGIALMLGSLLVAGPAAAQSYDSEYEDDPGIEAGDIGVEDEAVEPVYDDPIEEPVIEPVAIDDPYAKPTPLVEPSEPAMLTPFGMGLTVGGGVVGFTDSDFNNNLDTGGGWEARAIFGTRLPVALELGYVGTANEFKPLSGGVENDAILLSNGAEANLRLNLGTMALQPYLLAGAGWKHYSIENTDVNTSSMEDSDNVIEIPLGVGLSYSFNRFIADVRGTFRPALDNELIRSEVANDDNELHTWKAGANIGFEF